MSAPTFDSPASSCPICRRHQTIKLNTMVNGLLTCQHCQQRLVVSWSGHYVRDPFTRHLMATHVLRRESHPIARMLRDFGIAKHASLIATLGSLIFLSFFLAVLGSGHTPKTAIPTTDQTPQVVD